MSERRAQRLQETVYRATREKKKTAQHEKARSRLQFSVGEFQGLWELVASVGTCSRIGRIAHSV